jgi:hypothetical protein
MAPTPQETILKVLEQSLSNAQDAIARAEMQFRRMFYDHDTRNALEKYREWEFNTKRAIEWIKERN